MYLTTADVSAAFLDGYAAAAWAAQTAGQQSDLLAWVQQEINTRCFRSFDAADGSITRIMPGTDIDRIFLPELPLGMVSAIAVLYPGQTTFTALDVSKYFIDPWDRSILNVGSTGPVPMFALVGWPRDLKFQIAYTYGIDFSTAPSGGADPRLVRLYTEIRRAGLMMIARRLHLNRTPSNVASIKRGDSEERYVFPKTQDDDETTTPLEADIDRILRPWIFRGDPS